MLIILFSTGCGNRFTHANRHCPSHPFSRLKREEPKEGQGKAQSVDNKAVAEWLAKSVKHRLPLNTRHDRNDTFYLLLFCFFLSTHHSSHLCVCTGTGKPASSAHPLPPRPSRKTRRGKRTRSSRIPWSSSSLTKRRRPWRKRRAARPEVPQSDASRSSGSVSTAPWL